MREMQQRYIISFLTPKTVSSREGLNRCVEEPKTHALAALWYMYGGTV